MLLISVAIYLAEWVGHAYLWISALSYVYSTRLPKKVLRPWRLLTGVVVVGFPLLIPAFQLNRDGLGNRVARAYASNCFVVGTLFFPAITIYRLLRRKPVALVGEQTVVRNMHLEIGKGVRGEGNWAWAGLIPFNCIFRVDFTHLTLALPNLPEAWEGLTILLLGDLHFHGTPGRPYFDRIFDVIADSSPPDLICLVGDYLDTDHHHSWIGPLLGQLHAVEGKYAILGNHDGYHAPNRIRSELTAAGYRVLGNGWTEASIRGERCSIIGHEGPWFTPPPDLSSVPDNTFRLCLSHTPDNFYWGQRNDVGLMLCGHVHGGQIRLPLIGSIFVPSRYGRRFDMGVFESGGTVMVVSRGLSGKEPFRFLCHPQVIRITLRVRGKASGMPLSRSITEEKTDRAVGNSVTPP